MSNKIVYWLVYVVLLMSGIYVAAVKGVLTALWTHDTYYLTTLVVVIWWLTEVSLATCWFNLRDGKAGWNLSCQKVGRSSAERGSSFLQGIAVASTLAGLVLAFWPFLGIADLELIRAHIGDLVSGVAVAFVPSAVAFVLVVAVEVNITLLEGATA